MINNHKKQSKKPLLWARLLTIVVLFATFIFFFFYCVFLPRTTYSSFDKLTEKPTFSLAGLVDGSYTEGLSDYFSDTIYGRDTFKKWYAELKNWFGIRTVTGNGEEVVTRDDSSDLEEDTSTESSESLESSEEISETESSKETSAVSEPTESSSVSESSASQPEESSAESSKAESKADDVEISGSVLVMSINGKTWALEIYGGDANMKVIPKFCDVLNSFAEKNPTVNVMSMVIPKAAAYYLKYSETYASKAGNCLRDIQNIESNLSDKVTSISIYNTLLEHENEPIYFRTDHHWTALGAYYACQQLAKDMNLPFATLDTFTKTVRSGYIGTMYNYSDKNTRILNDPEEFVMYTPSTTYSSSYYDQDFKYIGDHDIFWKVSDDKVSSWYLSYLNGDSYAWKIQSNGCSNGRKLLIVKDSYGNCMVPWLLNSYEEIYVVDARKFNVNLNTFVQEQGITDVLFAEVAFSAVGSSYISSLSTLCQ